MMPKIASMENQTLMIGPEKPADGSGAELLQKKNMGKNAQYDINDVFVDVSESRAAPLTPPRPK
jgi:hypothetical protein